MIMLDLPPPPSVNKMRRYDWRNRATHKAWHDLADKHMLCQKRPEPIRGPYEVHIVMSPSVKLDLDNGIKCLLDFLHRIELVQGDSQKYLRRLTVEWGEAPEGCRIMVAPEYNADRDFGESINECYRAIKQRKANGGKGWGEW